LNVLITGAAGYREAVDQEATFVQADLADYDQLDRILRQYHIEAVIHLAANSIVGYSMKNPKESYRNNVVCGMNLLDTMLNCGIDRIVFSSSAAVYGEPKATPICESHNRQPINPYGETKAVFENILYWYGKAYGLKSISLRYFNAAGASDLYGEDHNPETHLIPNVLKVALGQLSEIAIFGNDYATRDGTCIRDYVHVCDIARAHILALKRLKEGSGAEAYNLGNGTGYSVMEVVDSVRRITDIKVNTIVQQRRAGDPAILVANPELARAQLGWQPEICDIDRIVESAWKWQMNHPYGYSGRN